jgi:hypothetical protein
MSDTLLELAIYEASDPKGRSYVSRIKKGLDKALVLIRDRAPISEISEVMAPLMVLHRAERELDGGSDRSQIRRMAQSSLRRTGPLVISAPSSFDLIGAP